MTRTEHANHRQLPGEQITVDVQLDEIRGVRQGRRATGRRACHSNQPAVPRGRQLGEPSSIPLTPPGQGRDPQVSRMETLESNNALECGA